MKYLSPLIFFMWSAWTNCLLNIRKKILVSLVSKSQFSFSYYFMFLACNKLFLPNHKKISINLFEVWCKIPVSSFLIIVLVACNKLFRQITKKIKHHVRFIFLRSLQWKLCAFSLLDFKKVNIRPGWSNLSPLLSRS